MFLKVYWHKVKINTGMVAGHKEKRNIISIFDTWKTKEPESQTSREKAGIAACMFVHF